MPRPYIEPRIKTKRALREKWERNRRGKRNHRTLERRAA